jgi:hypothetical protein
MQEISDEPCNFTSDKDYFTNFTGTKINYSTPAIAPGEFHILPVALLSEKTISQQQIVMTEKSGRPFFFGTEGDFHFDIFAAGFYLLSRYEEYLPHKKDMYGRFAHEGSLAWKQGFLKIPLLDLWLADLASALAKYFPGFLLKKKIFSFLPTYDIDEPYAYRHKPWWRIAAGALLGKNQGVSIKERWSFANGKKQDPYDAYRWMDDLHRQFNLSPWYFFLVAEKLGKYDKNISPANPGYVTLLKQHAEKYSTGIHPSWRTGDVEGLLQKEIKLLENICGKNIKASRQHYIRFTLPGDYRRLIAAGITKDFSMGYGSINGFRASVSRPFFWYDLEKEEKTSLEIFPFCFMDSNAFFEQSFTPQQAWQELMEMYAQIKSTGGMMITIFHNPFLGSMKRFEGWKEVYLQFIKAIV